MGVLVVAGCAEQPWTSPSNPGNPATEQLRVAVQCTADVVALEVRCDPPSSGARAASGGRVVMGGQGSYVLLQSSGTSYAGTIFQTNVTLQNRSAQPMGTTDGSFPDGARNVGGGIRIFFSSGPTVTGGSGTVTVANPDSVLDVTGPSQPAYIYEELLAGGATSASKNWQFNVPATVTSFSFQVQVSANVPQVGGVLRYRQDGAGLNAVSCLNASLCFAVGNLGTIRVWNGSTWSFMGSGTTADLQGVTVFSSTAAMAVGSSGTVLRWNGTYWKPLTSGVSTTLRGVWCAAATDCFIVGFANTIRRWDGTNFNTLTQPFNEDLYAVWGTANNNVYLAGNMGLLMRWDGAQWNDTEINTIAPHRGIWGSGPTDVYVVSGDDPSQPGVSGQIWHGSGSSGGGAGWAQQTNPTANDLNAVAGLGASNVFAVGVSGTLLQTTNSGVNWNSLASGTTRTLVGVSGGGTNLFLVGGGGTVISSTNSGANWATTAFGTESNLHAVWGTSSANVYAVGAGGTILKWNGTGLSQETSGTTQDLNGIWGAAANDVWAVGNAGTVAHYNGTAWSVTTLATAANFRGVWGSAANNVYIVGDTGAVWRWNGSTWGGVAGVATAATKEGLLRNLNAVWGSSATDVYFVGDTGIIVHGDGITWTQQPYETGFPIHRDLHGIWGTSPTDVWAVAKHTVILHNNGVIDTIPDYPSPPDSLFYTSGWDHMNVDGLTDLLAIHGTGVGDIYAVSDSGEVFHQNEQLLGDGGAGAGFWSRMSTAAPQSAVLRGIWAGSSTEVFIVGNNGLFVRGVR